MRYIVIGLLMTVSLFAYRTGDRVDPKIIETMGLSGGKVHVISFFASWCDSCKKELPELCRMKLDAGHAELIGVDVDTSLEDAKNFQAKFPINFRVINDTENKVVGAFNPLGMPALYYVKEGVVVKKRYGALPHITDVIQKDLEALK